MNFEELPAWVEWLAQDADGAWWGYECEPNEFDHGWYENELGRSVKIQHCASNSHWRDSLCKSSGVNSLQ